MRKRERLKKHPYASKISAYARKMEAEEKKRIIADAIMEAEERRSQLLKAQNLDDLAVLHNKLKIKDYSNKKNPLRCILIFFNSTVAFLRTFFISEIDVHGDRITYSSLRDLFSGFLNFINYVLIFVGLCFIFTPLKGIICKSWSCSIDMCFIYIAFGFLALVISRFFWVAHFEIKNIQDRNYIIGLITCFTAIVSVVLSVVTIILK